MNLRAFLQSIVDSRFVDALNSVEWGFPVVQSFHFIGFALLIGTITIVNLRLLNVGMQRQSAADLARDLAPWTWTGLILIFITGPIMFTTNAVGYTFNPSFRLKMTLLALGIISYAAVYRRLKRGGVSPGAGKLVAGLSLVIWSGVVFAGRFIAFV